MKLFSSNSVALLAVALGILNLALVTSGRLNAAPSDVRGSDNVAVASYSTSKGSYVLWSSGRITNAETGKNVAPPYSPVKGFVKASPTSKMPLGSPNVAVDYLQNSDGTFTIYADGSVMKADDEGASAPASGVDVMFSIRLSNSQGRVESGLHVTDAAGHYPIGSGQPLLMKLDREHKDGGLIVIPTINNSSTGRYKALGIPFGPHTGIDPYSGEFVVPKGNYWTGDWVIVIAK